MQEAQNETPQDFGKGQSGVVRRWLLEINLADKREKSWRETGQKICDRYRGKNRKKNSFNILWSNTETIAPAIYNSTPKPDVRRRFKDADPVGKTVSEVIKRALEFSVDNEAFSHAISMDVLDMLLAGRGLSRVRYVPSLNDYEGAEDDDTEEYSELAWEQCCLEHVQWDNFRRGEGKTWEELCWIAYYHRMTREELIKKFGEELGNQIVLDDVKLDDVKKEDQESEIFKTAGVWEIWDKDKKEVLFISPSYRKAPLKTVADPLKLTGFFPTPRPLYAIQDSSTLEPNPLFEQYREQAEELDRISVRINKIIDALKLRGIYDSTMGELSELMKGNDNDLIPTSQAAAWIEKGGIEKAIWMMPIDMAANVLQVLYQQRESTKQVIYEITGLGDIIRGQTNPNETAAAQEIKSQWGSQRISSMQREVQRYIRDCIRIMAEVISEHFQPETLLKMTGLKIPSQQELEMQYQQVVMQYQQQAQMAKQQGQQPPSPPPPQPQVVTIEQVMEVLRDDLERTFKIDVETDSTIAATIQSDTEALAQVLTGVVEFLNGIAPIVQSGALPAEAAKEIVMTICRRAKMGSAVEDALDQMQSPQPPQDPKAGEAEAKAQAEMAKVQAQMQIEQMKAEIQDQQHQRQLQADMQAEQMKAEFQAKLQAHEQEVQAQQNQHQQQLEAVRAEQASQRDMEREQQRLIMEDTFARWKAELEASVKIEVANISSKAKVDNAATQTATNEIATEVQQ